MKTYSIRLLSLYLGLSCCASHLATLQARQQVPPATHASWYNTRQLPKLLRPFHPYYPYSQEALGSELGLRFRAQEGDALHDARTLIAQRAPYIPLALAASYTFYSCTLELAANDWVNMLGNILLKTAGIILPVGTSWFAHECCYIRYYPLWFCRLLSAVVFLEVLKEFHAFLVFCFWKERKRTYHRELRHALPVVLLGVVSQLVLFVALKNQGGGARSS